MNKPTVIIVGDSALETQALMQAITRTSMADQVIVMAEKEPDISAVLLKRLKDAERPLELEPWRTKHAAKVSHRRTV